MDTVDELQLYDEIQQAHSREFDKAAELLEFGQHLAISTDPNLPAGMSAKAWKFGFDTFVRIWRQCRSAVELASIGLDREVVAISRLMFESAAVLEFVCLESIELPLEKNHQKALASFGAELTPEVRATMCLLHNEYERIRFEEDLAGFPDLPGFPDLVITAGVDRQNAHDGILDLEKELGPELSRAIWTSRRYSLVGLRKLAMVLEEPMPTWYWLFYRQASWSVHGTDMLSESEISGDGKSFHFEFQSNSPALGTSLVQALDLFHIAMVPFSLIYVGDEAWKDVIKLHEKHG